MLVLNSLCNGLLSAPWLVVAVGFGLIGYLVAGPRLGIFSALAMTVTWVVGCYARHLESGGSGRGAGVGHRLAVGDLDGEL